MSLITRCPSCETLFKVVPDQLRISDGWVRCGQCEEVFDASRHLLSEAYPSTIMMDIPPVTEPVKEPVSADIADFLDSLEIPDEPVVSEMSSEPDVLLEFASEVRSEAPLINEPPATNETSPNADERVHAEYVEAADDAAVADADSDPGRDEDSDSSWSPESESPPLEELQELGSETELTGHFNPAREAPLAEQLEEFVARRSQHAPLGQHIDQPEATEYLPPGPVAVSDEGDSVPQSSEFSFMRGFGRRSVWRKPIVRVGLGVTALVLMGTLAIQMTIQDRDRIAAMAPAAQPWVAAVCKLANCTIAPLRQIESIVIESSSFAKTRGDAYRFNFVLRNGAAVGLAMPAVELALTDPQNRPVIRRVFLPGEFGAQADALAPGSEWAGSLAVSVKLNGDSERISGYRVLAFYP